MKQSQLINDDQNKITQDNVQTTQPNDLIKPQKIVATQ